MPIVEELVVGRTVVRSRRLKQLVIHIGLHTGDLIFHAGDSTMCISIPSNAAVGRMGQTVRSLHDGLLTSHRQLGHPLVSLGCGVSTRCFGLSLISKRGRRFLTGSQLKYVRVVYPPGTSFASRGLRD